MLAADDMVADTGALQEGGNEPHVYGVAEDGYQHMFADHAGGKKNNQAIIITGESGAGKTYITGMQHSRLLQMAERCLQENYWSTSTKLTMSEMLS